MTRNRYPRETVEFTPLTITVDGQPVTDNVEVCIAANGQRPSTWTAAAVLDGKIGVMISALEAGWYTIFARVTSSPETPVIECGTIEIT